MYRCELPVFFRPKQLEKIGKLSVLGLVFALAGQCNNGFAKVGADTPFTSYEAESGVLSGSATIFALTAPPNNSFSSPVLEASGHAYVELDNTGDALTLTNTTGQGITALNIRYCIPDAPAGGGISATLNMYVDGVFRQSVSLNSTQTWCYETSGGQDSFNQSPTNGQPHIFYDETHFFITGAALASGSTVTFQKDSTNSASFYRLDVVDMENPPAALSQPANSLSIVDYGAVSNNPAMDSRMAIQNCFNDAKAQNKIAWIPPGKFYLNSGSVGLTANGITIQGAGMWYSTIYANPPIPPTTNPQNILLPTSCIVQDLAFDSNARANAVADGHGGGLNVKGNNWLVNRVWVQHEGAGIWADGTHGLISNCRTGPTWADGININFGDTAGNYLTVSNCFVRGSGDDGLAINSQSPNNSIVMINPTLINNTVVAPWWANNIGIYGGINLLVSNNLCMDSVGAYGISIGSFGTGDFVLSGNVVSNTVLRGGSYGFYNQAGVPAMIVGNTRPVANLLVAGNTISNAVFAGMFVQLCGSNVTVQNNFIAAPGQDGMDVVSGASGSAIIYSNTVTNLKPGKAAFANNSSTFVVISPITAANFNSMSGVSLEPCSEGGQAVTNIENGNWVAYNNVNLNGVNSFVARVASAGFGGNIEIRLDSPSGTLIGTCPVSGTGGWQMFANVFGNVTGASGTHTVYLVFTGAGGNLFNLEYFGFFAAPAVASHQLVPGNTYALKALINGKYVTAPNNGASPLIASSASIGTAEQFKIVDANNGNIGFQSLINNSNVCADNNGASPLIANRPSVGAWETFTEFDAGNGHIALRAQNDSKYVTAPNNGNNSLIASSTSIGTAESFSVEFVSGTAPATPTGLSATSASLQATLNWAASTGATGYNVSRSTVSGGPYTIVATNIPALGFTDTGLTLGTTYYYVVSAQNLAGVSTNSLSVSVTPGVLSRNGWIASASASDAGSPPANAIDGNASTRWATGANQSTGQWFQVDMGTTNTFYQIVLDTTTSGGDYPRSYQVQISNDGVNWSSSITNGSGAVVTTIAFSNRIARFIRVTQTGNSGPWWSVYEFNVFGTAGMPPVAPTGLIATAGDGQVALAWDAIPNVSGFNIKRSTTNGGSYTIIVTNAATLTYMDAGLPNNVTYYYVISALNGAGEGGNSAQVSALFQKPLPLTANVIAGNQIQLSWPTNDGGGTLKAYYATNLVPPVVWLPVTGAPVLVGNQWTLTLPTGTNNNGFYRLQQ